MVEPTNSLVTVEGEPRTIVITERVLPAHLLWAGLGIGILGILLGILIGLSLGGDPPLEVIVPDPKLLPLVLPAEVAAYQSESCIRLGIPEVVPPTSVVPSPHFQTGYFEPFER